MMIRSYIWKATFLLTAFLYLFSFGAAHATPAIDSPALEDIIDSSSYQFTWSANGTDVTEWWLYVGSASKSRDYFDSGSLGSDTDVLVTGIPMNGAAAHATLWYRDSNADRWQFQLFTYITDELAVSTPAVTSVENGDLYEAEITWTNNNSAVQQWWINLGTEPDDIDDEGDGGGHFYRSGSLDASINTINVPDPVNQFILPVTIYINLWYMIDGVWEKNVVATQYPGRVLLDTEQPVEFLRKVDGWNLKEFDIILGANPTLELHDPYFGSQILTNFWVYIGSAPGKKEYFDSGKVVAGGIFGESPENMMQVLPENSALGTTGNLPVDGSNIFVTVWYQMSQGKPGRWYRQTLQYTSEELSLIQ